MSDLVLLVAPQVADGVLFEEFVVVFARQASAPRDGGAGLVLGLPQETVVLADAVDAPPVRAAVATQPFQRPRLPSKFGQSSAIAHGKLVPLYLPNYNSTSQKENFTSILIATLFHFNPILDGLETLICF